MTVGAKLLAISGCVWRDSAGRLTMKRFWAMTTAVVVLAGASMPCRLYAGPSSGNAKHRFEDSETAHGSKDVAKPKAAPQAGQSAPSDDSCGKSEIRAMDFLVGDWV